MHCDSGSSCSTSRLLRAGICIEVGEIDDTDTNTERQCLQEQTQQKRNQGRYSIQHGSHPTENMRM